METAINYLNSLCSYSFSSIKLYTTDLQTVFTNTITHDLEMEHITHHFTNCGQCLSAAFASVIFPLVFIYSIYICCSLRKRISSDSCDGHCRQQTLSIYLYEALRWFRQAEYDLQAAKYDLEQEEPASEWSCFKCQQAAEKGIKAVLIVLGLKYQSSFKTTDNLKFGHNLYNMSAHSQDKQLMKLSSNLQGVFGHVGRMRYPDQLPYPKVPRDVYSQEIANNAIQLTESLLNHVKDKYLKLVKDEDQEYED